MSGGVSLAIVADLSLRLDIGSPCLARTIRLLAAWRLAPIWRAAPATPAPDPMRETSFARLLGMSPA